jgi:hypothetical protein
MAKMKPPRGGLKKGQPEKPAETIKGLVPALPCLMIILIAIGLLSMLFYASLAGMKVK